MPVGCQLTLDFCSRKTGGRRTGADRRPRDRDGPEAAGKSSTLPPVLVGCPSCKIGIGRCLINLHDKRPVLHVAEWVAGMIDGEDRRQSFRRRANETRGDVRVVKG